MYFQQQEQNMEEILEHDRQYGEDDYGDKADEAKAMQFVTAKFGGKMKNNQKAGAAEDADESVDEPN